MDTLSYLEMYQNITTETLFTKSLLTWADKIIVSRSETSPLRSIPQQQSATTTGKSLKNRGFFFSQVRTENERFLFADTIFKFTIP